MKRRTFLSSLGAASTVSFLDTDLVIASPFQSATPYFALHPFVAAHPEAVFIKRTTVSSTTATEEKVQAGRDLARELFAPSDTGGLPVGDKVAVKPNLTLFDAEKAPHGIGAITDAYFVEGLVEGMKDAASLRGNQFYLREGNFLGDTGSPGAAMDWYGPVTESTGAHFLDFDSGRQFADVALANLEEGSEVIWREVPNGVIFKQIGYMAPINADGAWSVNISKFKAHGMGITLCAKNWQGTNVHPYLHYCSGVGSQFKGYTDVYKRDIHLDYQTTVTQLYNQHLAAGVPRWDRPGKIDNWNSGLGMEMWAQKTLDNHSASNVGLHIIEGLYGQNGNAAGGVSGPGPDDLPEIFMTNVLVFGLNAFKVDIIGHWLAGHEPGNFGLFHAARDRGLVNTVNPHETALYAWEGGQPVKQPLESFTRTPLLTYYLQRDYNGQKEAYWHMVDEPFEYGPPTAILSETQAQPQAYVLGHNYPNPFNSSTLIEYRLPKDGPVRLEIFNSRGQVVDVLVEGWQTSGAHLAAWDAGQRSSGVYFYRFWADGFEQTRKMLLMR